MGIDFPNGLMDLDGVDVPLNHLDGKVVGLYFSASWYAPVKNKVRQFESLKQDSYHTFSHREFNDQWDIPEAEVESQAVTNNALVTSGLAELNLRMSRFGASHGCIGINRRYRQNGWSSRSQSLSLPNH